MESLLTEIENTELRTRMQEKFDRLAEALLLQQMSLADVRATGDELVLCFRTQHQVTIQQDSLLLHDPKCRAMLELLRDAGWLTDEFMPAERLHKPDLAQMASAVSYKRWGENRWVPFEQLWGVKNLANSMNRANNQKGSGDKAQEITRILKNMK